MPWGVAAAAGAGLVGQAISGGNSSQTSDENAALGEEQQAAGLISGVALPTINYTPYSTYQTPENLEPVNYTPYIGSATTTSLNPQDMAAEQGTLSQLQQFADNSWLPTDQETLQAALTANNATTSNAAAQTQQQLAAQGEGDSGASAVAEMMANQQAENADQQTGVNLATAALNRQLNAITDAGQEENTITGQNYTQSANNANILNSFNTEVQNLQTNAAASAAANQNAAQQFNIENQEGVSQANTNIENQNLDRTNELNQTSYENSMQKAEDQANAMMGVATGENESAAAAAQNAQASAAGTRSDIGLGIQAANAVNNTGNTSGNTSGTTSTSSSSPWSSIGNWLFGSSGSTGNANIPASTASYGSGTTTPIGDGSGAIDSAGNFEV